MTVQAAFRRHVLGLVIASIAPFEGDHGDDVPG